MIVFITIVYLVMLIVGWKRDQNDRIRELITSCDKMGEKVKAIIGSEDDNKPINENKLNKLEGQIDDLVNLPQRKREID